MSRILKRPMFRKGGSAMNGVMSLAAPRKQYQQGTSFEELIKDDPYLEEIYGIAQAGIGRDIEQERSDILANLLIRGGLGLVSGEGAGRGTLGAIAQSFKKPTEQALTEMRGLRQDPAKMLTAKTAIAQKGAERLKQIEYEGKQKEAAKDRIEVIQKQEDLAYPAAKRLYEFQENESLIEKSQGLPIGPRGGIIRGVPKRGKIDYSTFAKNATAGIYYDPDYDTYVRIEGNVATIIDSPYTKPAAVPKIDRKNINVVPAYEIGADVDPNDPFSGGLVP